MEEFFGCRGGNLDKNIGDLRGEVSEFAVSRKKG